MTMTTIWAIGLLVTLVVFVPLAVYRLHDLWRTARSIEIYARESLNAAQGIASHTQHIQALDATIAVATDVLASAGSIAARLDTLATTLADRTRS